MPTPIATGLCLAFIFVLLRRVAKVEPAHSWGLWVANVWIGIMISKPVTYWFNTGLGSGSELEAYLDGNPLERNVLIALIAAGLIVLLRRPIDWAAVFGKCPSVWLFYAFVVLSLTWSPYPFVTFKRLIRELGTVMMTLIILTETHQLDAVKRVFVRCAVVLVPLSVLFIKYYPEIGRYYHRWTYQVAYSGVTTNKNSLGLLAMIGGLFLLWHIAESRKGRTRWQRLVSVGPEAGVLVMCLWILNIANSVTALVCFVLGAVVFMAARTSFAGVSVKAAVGFVVVVGLSGWLVVQTSVLRGLAAQSVGRNATFTDRTEIWAAALMLPTNPIIGTGFASVWLTPEGWALKQRIGALSHAHNGYLETYLNGGAVGVALLIGVLFVAALQAGRHLSTRTSGGALYVALVIAGIVYNFTEVTFNNGNALGLLLWLIALSPPGLVLLQHAASPSGDSIRSRRPSAIRASPAIRGPSSRVAYPTRAKRHLSISRASRLNQPMHTESRKPRTT